MKIGPTFILIADQNKLVSTKISPICGKSFHQFGLVNKKSEQIAPELISKETQKMSKYKWQIQKEKEVHSLRKISRLNAIHTRSAPGISIDSFNFNGS